MPFITLNPATNKTIKTFQSLDTVAIETVINNSHHAFQQWKLTTFEERKSYLYKIASLLEKRTNEYATLMTLEMGKPIKQGRAEVQKCALVCRYYAHNGADFLKDEMIKSNAEESWITFEPTGAILAIMPWNYPFWQVLRFAAPNLMAGNTTLLKHAPNVPQCALAIEQLFKDAGVPTGVFQNAFIEVSDIEMVISDNRIKGVTLTGSTQAGRKVAALAGQYLKKCVLELGGSDPFIVFEDADIPKAVQCALESRMKNTGQSCIAAKRLLLHQKIEKQFIALFLEELDKWQLGDPMKETTDIGCLASLDFAEKLGMQVLNSIEMGAKYYKKGGHALTPFYEPTVLSHVKKGMPALEEELFGPVSVVIPFTTEAEAIHIANDTPFGLGASIWTKDIQKAKTLAKQLEVGTVAINNMVKSDPRLPFGGTKDSGLGRELSHYGIREFMNVKTITVN